MMRKTSSDASAANVSAATAPHATRVALMSNPDVVKQQIQAADIKKNVHSKFSNPANCGVSVGVELEGH